MNILKVKSWLSLTGSVLMLRGGVYPCWMASTSWLRVAMSARAERTQEDMEFISC